MTPYVVLADGVLSQVAVGDRLALDDPTHHHLSRVRRHRNGAAVTATDGSGAEVEAVLDGATLVVESVCRHDAPRPTIEVWQALGKQRKHDEVVRMLTEAGVDVVTATTTARTQVALAGKAERVRERWRAVAEAACAQARRPFRPCIDGPVELARLVRQRRDDTVVLVADPTATIDPLAALADLPGRPERFALVVGPEGGLTADETTDLADAGAIAVSLGPTVLRTEHAALVLASIVQAGVGRMG